MNLTVSVALLCIIGCVSAGHDHRMSDFSEGMRPKRHPALRNGAPPPGAQHPQRRFNNRPNGGPPNRPVGGGPPFRQNFAPDSQEHDDFRPNFGGGGGGGGHRSGQPQLNLVRPAKAAGTNLGFPPVLNRAGGGAGGGNKPQPGNFPRPQQFRPIFKDDEPEEPKAPESESGVDRFGPDEAEDDPIERKQIVGRAGQGQGPPPQQPQEYSDGEEAEGDASYYDDGEEPAPRPPAEARQQDGERGGPQQFRRPHPPPSPLQQRPQKFRPQQQEEPEEEDFVPQNIRRPSEEPEFNRPPGGGGGGGGKRRPNRPRPNPEEYEPQSGPEQAEEEDKDAKRKPDRQAILLQKTRFNCGGKTNGYYADEELDCEVFHYCQEGARSSWVCPEGARFHQVHLICMPQGDSNVCKLSSKYHFVNEYLYKPVNQEQADKTNGTYIYADRYYPEGYHAGADMNLEAGKGQQEPQRPKYSAGPPRNQPGQEEVLSDYEEEEEPAPYRPQRPLRGRPTRLQQEAQHEFRPQYGNDAQASEDRGPILSQSDGHSAYISPEEINIGLSERRPSPYSDDEE